MCHNKEGIEASSLHSLHRCDTIYNIKVTSNTAARRPAKVNSNMVAEWLGPWGVRSTGRQTNWATVNLATNQPGDNQLGDNQLGDNIWSTGRQIIKLENSIMQPWSLPMSRLETVAYHAKTAFPSMSWSVCCTVRLRLSTGRLRCCRKGKCWGAGAPGSIMLRHGCMRCGRSLQQASSVHASWYAAAMTYMLPMYKLRTFTLS